MERDQGADPFIPRVRWRRLLGVPVLYVCAVLLGLAWGWQVQRAKTARVHGEIRAVEAEIGRFREAIELNRKLEGHRDLLRGRIELISCVKGSFPPPGAAGEGGEP